MKKHLMNRERFFTRKQLTILEEVQTSYNRMPSGIDNINIVLIRFQLFGKLSTLISRLQHEYSIDENNVEEDLAILMIVGEGMKTSMGTANKATTSLSNHQVNLKMTNQGLSEITMMFDINVCQVDIASQSRLSGIFPIKKAPLQLS